MSTIVASHGYGADDDSVWFPYVKSALAAHGHHMHVPRLPDSTSPRLQPWRDALAAGAEKEAPGDTVLVGHSIGAVNVLRMLERHDTDSDGPFAGVVLVAAPAWTPPGYESLAEFFAEPFDWERLRRAARHYRLLTAADDPVLMPRPLDHVGALVAGLGATAVVTAGGAHFGATADDHIDLPQAVHLILDCLQDGDAPLRNP
jgi:predicted alpha/beta hydrolase family esterase